MAYKPFTLEEYNPVLAEIKKRQKKAEALRKSQQEFEAIRTAPRKGTLLPSQKGGLFETVPVYQSMGALGHIAQVGGGLLGDYLTGKEAKKEEEAVQAARDDAILRSAQQYGDYDPDAPPDAAQSLNTALGIQPAPKPATPIDKMGGGLAAAAAAPPDASATFEADPEGGTTATTAGGGQARTHLVGISPEANQRIARLAASMGESGVPENEITEAVMRQFAREKAKAGGSEVEATMTPEAAAEGAAPVPPAGPPAAAVPPVPPAPSVPVGGVPPPGGGPPVGGEVPLDPNVPPELEQYLTGTDATAPTPYGMGVPEGQNVPNPLAEPPPAPPIDPNALPPEQAAPPADLMQSLGIGPEGTAAAMEAPQAPQGTRPNQQAIRAFLGMLGGEDFDTESLIGKERRLLKTERLEGGRIIKHFTDGTSEVTDDIGESKSKERYDEATGYVYRSFMTGPNAGHAQLVLGEDGTPLKLTPSQANARGIAYGKAEGQAEGEYANRGLTAATTATVKGAETTAVKGAEHRAKARETLGKFAPVTQELRKSIQKLSTHPGLENITGEKGGRIPDDPKWRARWAALRAGTPEMEALALHDQLQGGTFLEGILPIIGAGAGQITEVEGAALKAAAGRLARSQSTDAYKRSLVDFNDLLDRIEARLEADSKEPTGTQSAPAAGGSMGDYEITVSP